MPRKYNSRTRSISMSRSASRKNQTLRRNNKINNFIMSPVAPILELKYKNAKKKNM